MRNQWYEFLQIQMKNPNEYREGDRLYIKKLRKCTCAKKEDEAYLLECHVIQRGTHEYTYKAGNQQIVKYGSNKALWLGPEAEKTVLDAAKVDQTAITFEAFLEVFEKGLHVK